MFRSVIIFVSLVLFVYGCRNQTSKSEYQIYLGPTAILPTSLPTIAPTPTGTLVMAETWTPTPVPTSTPLPDEVLAIVANVISGDTLQVILEGDTLDSGYTVDLIGINAPANNVTNPWGIVAVEQLNSWLRGKAVRLVRDNTLITEDGILPRYVYLNNEFINVRLLALGLAQVELTSTDRLFEADFQAAEQEAKTNRRGLWGPNPTPTVPIIATSTVTTNTTVSGE